MADVNPDAVRLPPYFPKVPLQCKQPAAEFFECFTRESDYDVDKVGTSATPIHAAESGRLTSSRPQLHSLPRGCRSQTLDSALLLHVRPSWDRTDSVLRPT